MSFDGGRNPEYLERVQQNEDVQNPHEWVMTSWELVTAHEHIRNESCVFAVQVSVQQSGEGWNEAEADEEVEVCLPWSLE